MGRSLNKMSTVFLLALSLGLYGCQAEEPQESQGNAEQGETVVEDMSSPDATASAEDMEGSDDQGAAPDGMRDPVDLGDLPPSEPDLTPLGGTRPAEVRVPGDYDHRKSYPLVLMLHGYGANADAQDFLFGLSRRVTRDQFILLKPNGTKNPDGKRFWNADEACCNFGGSVVDDVGYLKGLIAEARRRYNVDAERVYFIGHSNGGFMSYRMACDASELVAGIISLAGAARSAPEDCAPTHPVSVLQVHGDQDSTILYEGSSFGFNGAGYPSAEESVARWREHNDCQPTTQEPAPIDIERELDGSETVRRHWVECKEGSRVGLWTIQQGAHVPKINSNFAEQALAFFLESSTP